MREFRILVLYCCMDIIAASQACLAQQPQGVQHAPPLEQVGPQGTPAALPNAYTLNMMIRSSIVALNQANKTGNYTVLLDLASPAFRASNDSNRLAQIFARLRQRNLDLSPILFFTPKLLRQPQVAPNGILRLVGFFPTAPERVNFDLYFQMAGDEWKLFGIGVETNPADVTASVATNEQAPTPNAPNADTGNKRKQSAGEREGHAPAPVASAPLPERRPTGSHEVANDSNSEELQTAVENSTSNNATRIDLSASATGKTEQVHPDAVDSGQSLWDKLFSSD